MAIIEPGSATSGLVARVKGILLRTDAEWDVIDAEPATIKGIYMAYAVPLAAIGPICALIGSLMAGGGLFGLSAALVTAVVTYVLSLVSLYILALIIEALAPTFGGAKDRLKAFKVAAYASTAAWIAGVFGLLPSIAWLAVLGGLYSLFLLYKGLPKLMKTPGDKALPYAALVVVIAIVINFVIAAIVTSIVAATTLASVSAMAGREAGLAGKVKVGDAEIDLSQLEASAKQMEAAAKQMEAQASGKTVDGAVQAVPAETLQGLLPESLSGFTRTEVESNSGGVAGMQGSNAQGVYTKDDARITLSVTDMAAAGGLAGLAGAFNVTSNRQTASGYEKMGKVNGRMTTEQYDRSAQSGEYGVMVANRFMVQAQGSQVSIDQLKAAVDSVGLNRLEGLAKS